MKKFLISVVVALVAVVVMNILASFAYTRLDLTEDQRYTLSEPAIEVAQKFDSPPYIGYAVTCGITFTFGGLKIDTRCRVQDTSDVPIPGLYAAGELTGGLFYNNYPGGAGLMAGAVFGKIAGREAGQRSS